MFWGVSRPFARMGSRGRVRVLFVFVLVWFLPQTPGAHAVSQWGPDGPHAALIRTEEYVGCFAAHFSNLERLGTVTGWCVEGPAPFCRISFKLGPAWLQPGAIEALLYRRTEAPAWRAVPPAPTLPSPPPSLALQAPPPLPPQPGTTST